jgi:hypothetical protein
MKTAIAVALLLALSGLIGWTLRARRDRYFHQIERRLHDASTEVLFSADRVTRLRAEIGMAR